MAEAPFDAIGVGNAIVDVLSQADDEFLDRNDLDKGMMTLIDTDRARELYKSMGPGIEVSGGSAANTIAGLASLGGTGAYIGKVRNDQLGGVFSHDIRAAGVDFRSWPAKEGPPTARCLIFITPDAQRTMQTYLGISVELSSEDIDPEAIGSAKITYLEGYLFDKPEAKKAFVKAAEIAHAAGGKVVVLCPDGYWRKGNVDIVCARHEIPQVDDFDALVREAQATFDDADSALREANWAEYGRNMEKMGRILKLLGENESR